MAEIIIHSNKKKQQLDIETSTIWNILTYAKELNECSFCFYNLQTKEESDFLISSNQLLFIRYMLWRNTVIELSKLFGNSKERDKYNLHSFIKKFAAGQHYQKMLSNMDLLKKWEASLIANKNIIEKVLKLRDKRFAHTDITDSKFEKEINLSFRDIDTLIRLVEDIIQDIHSDVFNDSTHFDTMYFKRNRFGLIKLMMDGEKYRVEQTIKELNSYKNG